jgi:hypothetical protein
MGSGFCNFHFSDTIYLDYVTVSAAIRRFEDKLGIDQYLSEIFHNAQSQLEIGKT